MIGTLLRFFGAGGAQAIGRTLATWTGDRVQEEDHRHTEALAFEERVSAEAMAGAGRKTWWDSFVDGVNRLLRPVMTGGVVALFVWCVVDPEAFSAAMVALQLVPENLWYIMGIIVTFWFGERGLRGLAGPKIDPARTRAVISEVQRLREAAAPPPPDSATPVSEARYRAEMADTTKPLSNAVIEEWNRRRRAGG